MELKCVYVFILLMFCSCEANLDVLKDLTTAVPKETKLKLGTPDQNEKNLTTKQKKPDEKTFHTSIKHKPIIDTSTDATQNKSSSHHHVANAVANKQNDTLCRENLGTCQVQFHHHKLENGTLAAMECPPDHALLKALCSDEKLSCCVPSQEVQDTWNATDQHCAKHFGSCKLNTKPCVGNYESDKCGGPQFRSCCLPKWNDTKCSSSFGKCQASSDKCEGKYDTSLCDGPSSRSCCLPNEKEIHNWKVNDNKCSHVYGKCQPGAESCEGEKTAQLCGGPDSRVCCIPSTDVVHRWIMKVDLKCNKIWGTCSNEEGHCSSGIDKPNLCGGPSTRTCCIPDAKTIKIWSTKCSHEFGKCVMKTKTTCNSTSTESTSITCGESKHHVCCTPTLKEKASWEDSSCLKVKGKCQHTSTPCNKGTYQHSHSCGGPKERVCCVPNDHVHDDTACTNQDGKCQRKSERCSDGHLFDSNYKCREHTTRLCCVKKTTKTVPVSHNSNSKGNVNHATTHSGGQPKASILVPTILCGLLLVMGTLYVARKKLCHSGSYPYLRIKDKVTYETRGLLTSRPDAEGKTDLQVQLSV